MNPTKAMLTAAALIAVVSSAPARASGPTAGDRYFGFDSNADVGGRESVAPVLGSLRVRRGGRSVAATALSFECGTSDRAEARLSGPAGRRSPVRIRRGGRFTARGRTRSVRYALRGRFLSRAVARIRYRARELRSDRVSCRSSMTLYRNGRPPFSGCRRQPALTQLSAASGRVLQQFKQLGGARGDFYPEVYACLFSTPSKRVDLGMNYDETSLDTFRLAGPFVAYLRGEQYNAFPQHLLEVRDLRDGSYTHLPALPSPSVVHDVALKDTGSVAWTLVRLDVDPYGQPDPNLVVAREVWALDAAGQRMLDSGPNVDVQSLELDDSTVTWINDGAVHTATLY